MKRYICFFGLIFLFTQSCTGNQTESGSERLNCETPVLENRVRLDSPFSALSDIVEVAYRADLNSNEMELSLRDLNGNEIARALDIQLVDAADTIADNGDRVGTHIQKIGELELASAARQINPSVHEITFTTRKSNTIEMRVVATFRDAPCNERNGATFHLCAPQLLEDTSRLLLPSCGLDFDARLERGERPLLTDLRLEIPSKILIEGADGGLQTDELWSTFQILENGVERDPLILDAFIEAANLSNLLKQPDYRQLLTIAGDATWNRVLKQHVALCLKKGFEENQSIDNDDSEMLITALAEGNCGSRSTSGFSNNETRRKARVKGDPHLRTFDGRNFDFQAIGEFVLTRRTGDLPFEFQGRFAPIKSARDSAICDNVTWATGAAIKLPTGTVLTAEINDSNEFVVKQDGQIVTASTLPVLDDNHSVFLSSRVLRVTLSDNVEISITFQGKMLSLSILIPENDSKSTYEGLWGNADRVAENDLVGLDSQPLTSPISLEDIRENLRPKWAVDEQTSLFSYNDGETYLSKVDITRPLSGTVPAVPLEDREDTEKACIQLGVEPAFLLDCMLDLYCAPGDSIMDVGDELPNVITDRPEEITIEGDVVIANFNDITNLEKPPSFQCSAIPLLTLRVFPEGDSILAAPLTLKQAMAGGVKSLDDPLVIPENSSLESFLVTLPPNALGKNVIGSITFQRPVAAVVVAAGQIDVTNSVFLPQNVTLTGDNAELQETDVLYLSFDKRKLLVDWATQDKPLTVRVVLEASK